MKRFVAVALLLLLSACSSLPFANKPMDISRVILEKERISGTDNPARQNMIRQDLENKPVVLQNVIVKDILTSGNIDYEYCVVVETDSKKGDIEAFIYSKDAAVIANLVKNKTRINVSGVFKGFFTMRDHYYLKMEIAEADIRVIPEPIDIGRFILEQGKIGKPEEVNWQKVMKRDLYRKKVVIKNAVVKEVAAPDGTNSTYRVIIEADSPKGKIEGLMSSGDAETARRLAKGKTGVEASGTLIDYQLLSGSIFAKIEIKDARISIKE